YRSQIQKVCEVDRHAQHWHRGYWNFDECTVAHLPTVRPQRPESVADGSTKRASFTALFRAEFGGRKIQRASQRQHMRGERRRVIKIATLNQCLQRRAGKAIQARTTEADWPAAGGVLDVLFGRSDLRLDFLAGIVLHPRLVQKGMTSDLVTGIRDRTQRRVILRQRRVLPNDEKGDRQITPAQKLQNAGHNNLELPP